MYFFWKKSFSPLKYSLLHFLLRALVYLTVPKCTEIVWFLHSLPHIYPNNWLIEKIKKISRKQKKKQKTCLQVYPGNFFDKDYKTLQSLQQMTETI